tara:strand:- start:315 stop:581 length:267 start_codon:yes stop_codon:yes gene_type:complete
MDDLNLNKDDLPKFKLPQGFLEQLFEFSGSSESNRGFLLVFINQEGAPMVYSKSSSQIIEMGLRKAAERFLLDSEEAESNFDIGGEGQ